MKRISLAMLFACCMLAMMAQFSFKVNYKGAKPTITDMAWAYCNFMDDPNEPGDKPSNAILQALIQYRNGLPQYDDDVTFVVDEKNGYILYEYKHDTGVTRMEMCYWNEADGKHKLFAFNNMASIVDDEPLSTETTGMTFCRYNNATKKMTLCDPPGFEIDYQCVYALPRTGKNITVTKFLKNGQTTKKTLKWNGKRFSY